MLPSPSSSATTCDNSGGATLVEETVTAGSSSVTYDRATDEYI
jgi:hypothetical protein